MRAALWSLSMLAILACSSRTELICHGSACTCPSESYCVARPADCGPTACTLACGARSTCTGSCGDACAVDCQTDASCDFGVGTGGSLACGAGGDCHLTCATSCTMTCAAGASCTIRCATDTEPRLFTGTASCP